MIRSLTIALVLTLGLGVAHADGEKDYVPWYKGPLRAQPDHAHVDHRRVRGGLLRDDADGVRGQGVPLVRSAGVRRVGAQLARLARRRASRTRSAHTTRTSRHPLVGLTLLYYSDKDASWRRLIDDTVPVFETVAISETFVNLLKITVARQRPYAHFGGPGREHLAVGLERVVRVRAQHARVRDHDVRRHGVPLAALLDRAVRVGRRHHAVAVDGVPADGGPTSTTCRTCSAAA